MSKFRVAITDYVFPNLEPEAQILGEVGAEVVPAQCKSQDDLKTLVAGVDAVLNTYYGPIDGEVMDCMPDCRVIVRYGIGVDTIDIPAATERGIMVANVPDYCIDEVADHALAMLLSLVRKLPQSHAMIESGAWSLGPLKPMRNMKSLTVGVVGMGRIGRAIASRIRPFGSEIVFFDPYASQIDGCRSVTFDELLSSSDAIILQAPATPETRHMLNDDTFARMTKQPIVVNCARGELVDTDALVRALDAGQVSAVGLDVIEDVPPISHDHPLLGRDNVTLAPHSAWFSTDALGALQRLAAMEVARVLRGERPKSLLNPEVLGG